MGNRKIGVRMLFFRETLGFFWSMGRGRPTSMNALHSQSFPSATLASCNFSMAYLLKPPASAAMIASLNVQPCACPTALMALVGTGGRRVKTCRPLNFRNGLRSLFGALKAISPSSFNVRIDSTPRKNILTEVKMPTKQPGLGADAAARGRADVDRGGASLPSSAAGSRIFGSTSPSSQDSVGRKAKRSPNPSLMTWWMRTTTAERPLLARRLVTCQSGRSRRNGEAMTLCR
mmetsp:Transcript_29371/g.83597  ORF Transcript_29371/g.83597 Transcript_29371/m.83597 type:complete len:232 (-) Transcript_29371:358-1053(-)